MRKVKKLKTSLQLPANKPLPIIRFDIQDYNTFLLCPPTNRAIKFCKPLIQRHMAILKLSAAEANSVCLASNQLALDSSLIAIHKHISKHQSEQRRINWIDTNYNLSQNYQTYHCPQVVSGSQLVQQIQESISYPFFLFKVKRYNKIGISFLDQSLRTQFKQLIGFKAWVFQQAHQQLNGQTLLDWRINHGNIEFNAEAAQRFPKTLSVIQEYVQDISKTFREYPHLLEKPEKFGHPSQRKNSLLEQTLPYQSDFYKRVAKHYERQMSYLQQKISQGLELNGLPQQWKKPKKIDVKIIDK